MYHSNEEVEVWERKWDGFRLKYFQEVGRPSISRISNLSLIQKYFLEVLFKAVSFSNISSLSAIPWFVWELKRGGGIADLWDLEKCECHWCIYIHIYTYSQGGCAQVKSNPPFINSWEPSWFLQLMGSVGEKRLTLNSLRMFATMMETPLKEAPMTPATGCWWSWYQDDNDYTTLQWPWRQWWELAWVVLVQAAPHDWNHLDSWYFGNFGQLDIWTRSETWPDIVLLIFFIYTR